MNAAGLLALSDERDRWLRRLLAAERAAFHRGAEYGWRLGYEASCRDQEAAWRAVAGRVARGASNPTFAELELRRWGPGGREHFGDPRPDDRHPGRRAAR
jgi:hypothetical protein